MWPGSTGEAPPRKTARRGSRARSCMAAAVVVAQPRPRRIAVRTGTVAADTDCCSAPVQGRLAADKGRPAGKGPTVDMDTGTGKDIRGRPRHQWARNPASLNSCPVYPFACPSASLQLYKVLKIIENNAVIIEVCFLRKINNDITAICLFSLCINKTTMTYFLSYLI